MTLRQGHTNTLNSYSDTWFKTFLHSISPTDTAREIEFVRGVFPQTNYHRILDLCCGDGRHCEGLVNQGYEVVGLDRDESVLVKARRRCPSAEFIAADMRNLNHVSGSFDGIICLWQSFGYFDEATNTNLFARIHDLLVHKGRLVLDVYNREFFAEHLGTWTFNKEGMTITESKTLQGRRLGVTLNYSNNVEADHFDWEVYTRGELRELSSTVGFTEKLFCSRFDPTIAPSSSEPRMQLVVEK